MPPVELVIEYWMLLVPLVLHGLGILFIFDVLMNGRTSQGTIAWVMALFFFPYLAVFLYLMFGARRIQDYAAAHQSGQLQFFGEHQGLADAQTFNDWIKPLRQCEWVVYAKRPFAGPAAVLAYLSRYTHRVAIANSRLLALDERGVTFRWSLDQDYVAGDKAGVVGYCIVLARTSQFGDVVDRRLMALFAGTMGLGLLNDVLATARIPRFSNSSTMASSNMRQHRAHC